MLKNYIRPLLLVLILPAHELGHFIMAHVCGFPVLIYTFTSVTFELIQIPTPVQESLIYLGGFLLTFIPSAIVTVYLVKKGSLNWDLSFLWTMASPGVAVSDFAHIGSLINPVLSPIFLMIVGGSTAVMFLLYVKKVK